MEKPPSDSLSAEKSTLKIIKELGLRHSKKISREALIATVKERWPDCWERVLGELLNSGFIRPVYVVDLNRKKPEQSNGLAKMPGATHNQIQLYVEAKYGFIPKSSWITDVKEQFGIKPLRKAPNGIGKSRRPSCPKQKVNCIKYALLFYGLI